MKSKHERLKRAWTYLMNRWTWEGWNAESNWTTTHLAAICRQCDILHVNPW